MAPKHCKTSILGAVIVSERGFLEPIMINFLNVELWVLYCLLILSGRKLRFLRGTLMETTGNCKRVVGLKNLER